MPPGLRYPYGGEFCGVCKRCSVRSRAGNEWYHPQPPARPLGRIWRCKGAEDPFKSCSQRGVPLQVGAPLGMSCSRIHSTPSSLKARNLLTPDLATFNVPLLNWESLSSRVIGQGRNHHEPVLAILTVLTSFLLVIWANINYLYNQMTLKLLLILASGGIGQLIDQ